MFESSERVRLMKLARHQVNGKLGFFKAKRSKKWWIWEKIVHLGAFYRDSYVRSSSKFNHSKFGSFVGSIKVGSVRSKFGKDEVQTALYNI